MLGQQGFVFEAFDSCHKWLGLCCDGRFSFLGGILAEGKHQRWWLIGFSYEMNQS